MLALLLVLASLALQSGNSFPSTGGRYIYFSQHSFKGVTPFALLCKVGDLSTPRTVTDSRGSGCKLRLFFDVVLSPLNRVTFPSPLDVHAPPHTESRHVPQTTAEHFLNIIANLVFSTNLAPHLFTLIIMFPFSPSPLSDHDS